MQIIPAIDLKDGKAVRLTKGEMQNCKIYGKPLDFAMKFEQMGAEWLHIVDLDGAFAGSPKNLLQIQKIRESCNLKIQLGGGIRDESTIKKYVDLGISRVILGSIALKSPDFAIKMAQIYPIAIGIDAKNGFVATEGWTEGSDTYYIDLAKQMEAMGVKTIIYTDISKDGTLSGPNVEQLVELDNAVSCDITASGGVTNIDDIVALRDKNLYGAICGKSIYKGTLDLKQAVEVCK